MVSEHVVGNGFRGTLDYQEQTKKEPQERNFEIVEQQGVFGTTKDISRQMRYQAQERERVKKPVGHLIVSFPKTEKLTKEQELKAVKSVMKEVNVTDTQYRIVKHNDKEHSHYHIAYNRVNNSGELINDHKIKDRLQVACSKVEREQGLQSHDKSRTCVYDPTNEKGYRYQPENKRVKTMEFGDYPKNDKEPQRAEKKENLSYEISTSLSTSKSVQELSESLKQKGIEMRYQERNGKVSAMSFQYQGIKVKASQLGLKAKEVNNSFEKNISRDRLEQARAEALKNREMEKAQAQEKTPDNQKQEVEQAQDTQRPQEQAKQEQRQEEQPQRVETKVEMLRRQAEERKYAEKNLTSRERVELSRRHQEEMKQFKEHNQSRGMSR